MHFVPHTLQTRRRRAPLGVAGIAAAAVIGYALTRSHTPTLDPQIVVHSHSAQAVAKAQTAFGIDLLGRLTQATPGHNIVFSPASIATILTLTMSGAGGRTRADMARTLHLSLLPTQAVNTGSKLLMQSENLPASSGVTLSVANALWADTGMTFAPTFLHGAQDNYNADAQTLDFSSPSAAAAINDWVDKNTQGHITEIVTPENLQNGTNVVLTNAVYFAGTWKSAFDKSATQNAPFTLASGTKEPVPLMTQDADEFAYQENAQFQAVRLPYDDGRFAMDVFLPRKGLDKFLPTVTAQHLATWNVAFQPAQVKVFLPRWKMRYETELSASLKSLGMSQAFSRGADFAPMGLPDDYISEVIHKATLDVDEQGTVATAATAVVMTVKVYHPPPPIKVFRADHPFLFAIRDTKTGGLLFIGAVYDPKG